MWGGRRGALRDSQLVCSCELGSRVSMLHPGVSEGGQCNRVRWHAGIARGCFGYRVVVEKKLRRVLLDRKCWAWSSPCPRPLSSSFDTLWSSRIGPPVEWSDTEGPAGWTKVSSWLIRAVDAAMLHGRLATIATSATSEMWKQALLSSPVTFTR